MILFTFLFNVFDFTIINEIMISLSILLLLLQNHMKRSCLAINKVNFIHMNLKDSKNVTASSTRANKKYAEKRLQPKS